MLKKKENEEKKYWLDKFLLQPGDSRWLQILYKIITWIFTAGISFSVIGIVASIIQMITESLTVGLETLGYTLSLAFLAVIIYFFGMLLMNLLDNVQTSRINSTKTLELLEKILASKDLDLEQKDEYIDIE